MPQGFRRHIDLDMMDFLMNQISERIDKASEYFMKRVAALQRGDRWTAEFIEEMHIKMLDAQVSYLVKKLSEVLNGEKND